VAGVGEEGVHRTAVDRAEELVDSAERRQVGVHGIDAGAEATEGVGGFLDPWIVRGDNEIESFLGADRGQLVADSARGAGDDRERPTCGCHWCLPPYVSE